MKTIIYSLAVAFSSFLVMETASAQYGTPPQKDACHRPYDDRYHSAKKQSFYYYPKSNIYYNPAANRYIFYSRNAWVVSDRLPRYYRLRGEQCFVVYHNGFDVWNANRIHSSKYRNYRRNLPDVAYGRRNHNDEHNYPKIDYNAPY